METTAGFVLCGGQSRRMGRDKALLPYGTGTLVEHMARLVATVAGSATLVGSRSLYGGFGYPVLEDVQAGAGPLAGLVTLLGATTADLNLVVPCDMPGLEVGLVSSLLDAATSDPSVDVALPMSTGGVHPLSAVYRKSARRVLAERLALGELRVRDAVKLLKCIEISTKPEVLANVNTPGEWVRFAEA